MPCDARPHPATDCLPLGQRYSGCSVVSAPQRGFSRWEASIPSRRLTQAAHPASPEPAAWPPAAAQPNDPAGPALVAGIDRPTSGSLVIDGVRIDWPDGFGLIRASNTTPVLVLRFEGQTVEALHRIEAHMLALLRQVKPDAVVGAAAH